MARERSKLSLNNSVRKNNLNKNHHIDYLRKANSAVSNKLSSKNHIMKKSQVISHPLIDQTPDISHLLIKSLV